MKRQLIESESKKPNAKDEQAITNPFVYDAFKQNIWNLIDVMGETSVYELSHWTANQVCSYPIRKGMRS
jgi:hypothetical protein